MFAVGKGVGENVTTCAMNGELKIANELGEPMRRLVFAAVFTLHADDALARVMATAIGSWLAWRESFFDNGLLG